MKVRDVVERKGPGLYTARGHETVEEIVGVLHKNKISAVVVVDDDRHVSGILTERDVVRGLVENGAAVLELPARELMTTEVHTCKPDDPVSMLAAEMYKRTIRHLPVVDADGRLFAVVSIRDVVNTRLERLTEEHQELITYMQS